MLVYMKRINVQLQNRGKYRETDGTEYGIKGHIQDPTDIFRMSILV